MVVISLVLFVRVFGVARAVLAATLYGLTAPYEPAIGYWLTIRGPWTKVKRFEH